MPGVHKMAKHTLKILQYLQQEFEHVFDFCGQRQDRGICVVGCLPDQNSCMNYGFLKIVFISTSPKDVGLEAKSLKVICDEFKGFLINLQDLWKGTSSQRLFTIFCRVLRKYQIHNKFGLLRIFPRNVQKFVKSFGTCLFHFCLYYWY